MSRFEFILPHLHELSTELQGVITLNRNQSAEDLGFEELRLDWKESHGEDVELRKAFLFQPKLSAGGVDSSLWSFRLVAWIPVGEPGGKKAWGHVPLQDLPWDDFKREVKGCLPSSLELLQSITKGDLRWPSAKFNPHK